jgi:8-oxo-dGTP pyrophosphatase MutT (NUDIX family)
MDPATESAEIVRAAGVICRAPDGSILMLKRVDTGEWAFPGGCIEGDETPEEAAYRETFEETGRRLGSAGGQLMRRIKDGVDFTTFISDVDAPFIPTLNHEHSAFAWVNPDVTLLESRAESLAIADSAGDLETPPSLNDDGLDAPADEDDIDDETAERIFVP